MTDAASERRNFLHRVAGLLEDEGDLLAEPVEMDRGGNRQAPVAVDRDPRHVADRLPDLVDDGDVFFQIAPPRS